MGWHSIKKEAVIKELSSNINGLSNEEAEKRLKEHGENIIKDSFGVSPLKILFSQLNSFIIYVLLAATIISLIIQHYIDAGIIFAIIVLNATIGFVQQYKAEKSILELKKILVPYSKVMRNGKLVKIPSIKLVPGDILIFHEGDKITADCRILEAENLEVNEAILTGESLSVEKFTDVIKDNIILAERKNMFYTGTSIVKGNAKAVVVETGMHTEFGKIAQTLKEITVPETPMQKKLDKFAKQITLVILIIAAIMIILGIIKGQDKFEMLLMSIALAISAIPEGLPAVIVISLAFATRKMLADRVIIRRLPAAETLGSVTIICSDKTGTITEERMKVSLIFSGNKFYEKADGVLTLNKKVTDLRNNFDLYQLLKASVLCNNARFEEKSNPGKGIYERYDIIGDPTESALVISALDLGVNRKILTEQEPRVRELSFTSERKLMSIIRQSERRNVIYTKGAAKNILSLCEAELINSRIERLSEKRKKELHIIAEKMESEALRVLGFAYRNLEKVEENPESGLIFLGFIGMQDKPRKEVKEALERCIEAGIKVKMITGDSALTAKAIGKQIGMVGKIVTGQQLEKISDEDLKKEIDNITIFARINPDQKLRIVEILKQKGEEVAITGDGVNDILALKKADIGIAMGIKGTDVAREVSDMILIDDNFVSIVKAVEEGRIVYDNTKKITKYLLAVNFSEIFLISYAIIMRLPLPLLPIHILWMNLVTDSIPALSLAKEKGENVMQRKPIKEKSILDNIFWYILIAGALCFFVEIFVFLYTLNKFPIEKVRTLVLTADILFEMFFIFTVRSNKKLKEIGVFSNKYLIYAILISLVLHLFVIYTPLNTLFKLTPLGFSDWLFIVPLSLIGVLAFEIWKYVKKK